MSTFRALLAELVPLALDLVVDALERDPELAKRTRAVLGLHDSQTGPAFLSRRRYARRADYAVRTIDKFLRQGLPHTGEGKLLRIPVADADRWLLAHLSEVHDDTDATIAEATANAKRRRAS